MNLYKLTMSVIGLVSILYTCLPSGQAEITRQHIYGAADRDDATNGNDFFVVDDTLFLILWKYGKVGVTSAILESILVWTPLGHNTWQGVPLPGKVYFLGTHHRNELCAIEQKNHTWSLNFYDIANGQNVRTVKYTYDRVSREYRNRPLPVPVPFADGSLAFYGIYHYDTSHPIMGTIETILSGGHGQKPKSETYLEIIPALWKRPDEQSPISYVTMSDASSQTTIISVSPEWKDVSDRFTIRETQRQQFRIVEYTWDAHNMNLYQQDDGSLISVSSDGIHISYDMISSTPIAPLPPFPINRTQEGTEEINYLHPHFERTSDVAFDRASGDILYAFFDKGFTDITCCSSCSDTNRGPHVYVYFYHQATQTWIANILPVKRLDNLALSFHGIRLYWWKDHFYIGLWRYPHTVTIFHGALADVQKGGTLPISSTEARPLGESPPQ